MSLVDRLLLQYAVHKGLGVVVTGDPIDPRVGNIANVEPGVLLEHAHIASPSSETSRTAGVALCALTERLRTMPQLVGMTARLYRACLASIYTEAERQMFRQIACHLLDEEGDGAQNDGAKSYVTMDATTWIELKRLVEKICGENQVIWMGIRATVRIKEALAMETGDSAVPSLDRIPVRIYRTRLGRHNRTPFIRTVVDPFGTYTATSHETEGVNVWRTTNRPTPDIDPLAAADDPRLQSPKRLVGHSRPVYDMQFLGRENGESSHICTASGDGRVVMWSLSTGRQVTDYHAVGEMSNVVVWSLDTHHHSNRLVTGAQNNSISLFTLDRRRPVRIWAEATAVDCVKIANDGNTIYAASNQLTQYDARAGRISLVYSLPHPTPVQHIVSTTDGRFVIIAHANSGSTYASFAGCYVRRTTYDSRTTLPLARSPSMPSPLVSMQVMESTGDYVLLGDDHGRVAIDCGVVVGGCSAVINRCVPRALQTTSLRYQLPNLTSMHAATFVEGGEVVVVV